MFVSPKLLPLLMESAKEFGLSDERIHILGESVENRLGFDGLVERAQKKHLPPIVPQPAKKDTLAYLVFSSGTSGLPKGSSSLCNRKNTYL